jgi:hypothetical protein
MFDFQVCEPRAAIPVAAVRYVLGLPIRTLDITGEDFRSVDEVLVNQIPSPDVMVMSKTRLLAQVPDALSRQTITSVSVISSQLTVTERSFIDFRISRTPGKVSGILRLMQLFLKTLFTTPGSDIFSPKRGGGGLSALGQNFGLDQGGDIVSSFIVSVDNTTRQIIQVQGRQPSVRADERLLTARVTNAGYSKTETALLATIEILSQAGRAATARLEL